MNYYSEDLLSSIDMSIVLHPMFESWFLIVKDILLNDEFQRRKMFMHHHDMTVWDHSILVSFKSYLMGRYFHADLRVCAIAGLLHDFYSQAWISTPELEKFEGGRYTQLMKEPKSLFKMHGFTHAKDAAQNYVKYFPELENKKITDSIKRHMFPLNIIPPRYKEGFILTMVDKWNSVHELPSIKVVPKVIHDKAIDFLFKKV